VDLFEDIAPKTKQHPIYQLLCEEKYAPERAVVMDWARGFPDRDGKFPFEFQTTFEPCLWELYVFAFLKEIRAEVNFSFSSPDFVVNSGQELTIEATICAPPAGGAPPHGHKFSDLPDDLNEFNSQATLRICNSFTSKAKKYKTQYSVLPHVKGKPFVVAIASFDRPFSHMVANRPIISALYGVYFDEELTIANKTTKIVSYGVCGVVKRENIDVPLGYFLDKAYRHVSAVVYSPLATWGKLRALADNPFAKSVYMTFHPGSDGLMPLVKSTPKDRYLEHLLDGLYVFHNPFADHPLHPSTFSHPRLAQFFVNDRNEFKVVAPDDFLLSRFLQTISTTR
jgi:hypothetical protein